MSSTDYPTYDSLADKRRAALEYLGSNHVLHPAYQPRERHSNMATLWYPQRSLREVETEARKANRI